jgi:hypothetical protein
MVLYTNQELLYHGIPAVHDWILLSIHLHLHASLGGYFCQLRKTESRMAYFPYPRITFGYCYWILLDLYLGPKKNMGVVILYLDFGPHALHCRICIDSFKIL